LVAVISYNSAESTLRTVQSLCEQTYVSHDILLIDNGSSDETVRMVREQFPNVRIEALTANVGYARGVNFALDKASEHHYEHVLVCNHDILVPEDAVEMLVQTALDNPQAGVIGCIEYNASSNEEHGAGGGEYSQWFSTLKWRSPDGVDTKLSRVFCVQGALFLVTAAALRACIRIDESLFMYFEEVDLGFRLRSRGLPVLVDQRVRFVHRGSPTPYAPYVGHWMQRNRLYILKKYCRWYQVGFYILYSSILELPARCLLRSLQGHAGYAKACINGQIAALKELLSGNSHRAESDTEPRRLQMPVKTD
jgi:GT2 family glycosyltransferase